MTTPQPTPTPPPNGGGGGGNVFTRQIGPLPLWGWMGIGLAAALALTYWRQNKAASKTTTTTGGATGTTDSSLIPQFVNQTYVDQVPPTAPPVPGPPGAPGPAGPPGAQGSPGPAGITPPAPRGLGQAAQYPAPKNVQASRLSNTSVKVIWDYITSINPRPTSYTLAVYNKGGKLISQSTVNAPDTATGQAIATISGLPKSGGPFHVNVWANGGSKAPNHGTADFTL